MKKILITILCVFLALVFIGTVLFPESDFFDTVDLIKLEAFPIFTTFNYVSEFCNELLITAGIVGEIFDKEANMESLDSLVAQSSNLYLQLSDYLPRHIEEKNLTKRASNQGLSIYTSKISAHQHKVSLFRCVLGESINRHGKYIHIVYCGVCNEILFMMAAINNSGSKYLFPLDKSGEVYNGIANLPFVCSVFDFNDI